MKHEGPHKYQLITIKRIGRSFEIYKCVLPECHHLYYDKQMALGNLSLCHGTCGGAIQIDRDQLRLKKPMCRKCRQERAERRRQLMEVGRNG